MASGTGVFGIAAFGTAAFGTAAFWTAAFWTAAVGAAAGSSADLRPPPGSPQPSPTQQQPSAWAGRSSAVTNRTISVAYLYPDVMSTFGDRGNIAAIVRRCRWRDIGVTVTELRAGDKVVPREVDLIMIGGGGESRQQQVAADLYKVKGGGIREAVAAGTAVLAVGGGYELFGRFCEPCEGRRAAGNRTVRLVDDPPVRRPA